MSRLPRYNMCFLCGEDNPIGLKLTWSTDKMGAVYTEFAPQVEHQGFKGTVHGGIISALLDETMGLPAYVEGKTVVTASLEVKFRKPAPIGKKLFVKGETVRSRSRIVEAKGSIIVEEGDVIAEGYGKYRVLSSDKRKEVEAYLDHYEG